MRADLIERLRKAFEKSRDETGDYFFRGEGEQLFNEAANALAALSAAPEPEPVAWQQRQRMIRNGKWGDWYPSDKEAYDEIRSGKAPSTVVEYEARALVVASPPNGESREGDRG